MIFFEFFPLHLQTIKPFTLWVVGTLLTLKVAVGAYLEALLILAESRQRYEELGQFAVIVLTFFLGLRHLKKWRVMEWVRDQINLFCPISRALLIEIRHDVLGVAWDRVEGWVGDCLDRTFEVSVGVQKVSVW